MRRASAQVGQLLGLAQILEARVEWDVRIQAQCNGHAHKLERFQRVLDQRAIGPMMANIVDQIALGRVEPPARTMSSKRSGALLWQATSTQRARDNCSKALGDNRRRILPAAALPYQCSHTSSFRSRNM